MVLSGLYAITPDTTDTPWLLGRVEQALRGGARVLQYRAKTAGAALRATQAPALRALAREHAALFVVNDDVLLARACGADGVHLGRDDGDLAQARAVLGAGVLLGVSCYDSLERARAGAAAGADYLAFGSFFASSVKPGAVRPAPGILSAARALGLPRVAIGGITPDNAAPLIEAGADAVAVISALFAVDDTRAAAARFAQLFARPATGRPGQEAA